MRRWESLLCALLFVTTSMQTWSQSLASDQRTTATHNLAQAIAPLRKQEIAWRLADSGLAPQEMDRIAVDAAERYAKCFVDALAANDDPWSKDLLAQLAQAATTKDVDAAMDTADGDPDVQDALAPVVKECIQTVDLELGLPLAEDAT